jgi:hypothetical protein
MGRVCDMHGEEKCIQISGEETWRAHLKALAQMGG